MNNRILFLVIFIISCSNNIEEKKLVIPKENFVVEELIIPDWLNGKWGAVFDNEILFDFSTKSLEIHQIKNENSTSILAYKKYELATDSTYSIQFKSKKGMYIFDFKRNKSSVSYSMKYDDFNSVYNEILRGGMLFKK